MKMCKPIVGLAVVAAVAIVLFGGVDAQAAKPDCPHSGLECPMVWDPVICDDGQIYSNSCVAKQHCAKGCTAYGDGAIELDKKKPIDGGCPRIGINCLDVWNPVICDDGQVYSNSCYAYVACATGCEPYGDGGVYELDKATCDRPKICPKLWAPVICDDGNVYPNDCYAQKKCATGCEPYGEWLMGDEEDKAGGCDRPKFCPALWAPVICDDGKVYPNDCYAQKKCATGCVPYGDVLAVDGDKKKPIIDDGCPRIGWMCPDLWNPVICDDGEVYSNSCYAWVACAEGCEPYGDGGVYELDKATCVRPKICPKLLAPVICDDGKVYPNSCYAQKKCATGCVPYDE